MPCSRSIAHSLPCERSARPLLCCIPHMRLQDNISSHLVVPLLLRLSLSRRCHRAAIAQLRACCSPLSTPSHNLISQSGFRRHVASPSHAPSTLSPHTHTSTHTSTTHAFHRHRRHTLTPCISGDSAPPSLPLTFVRTHPSSRAVSPPQWYVSPSPLSLTPLPRFSSSLLLFSGGRHSLVVLAKSLSLSRKPGPAAVLPPSLFRRRTSC